MGTRGPVPKPVSQRLGHLTKAQKAAVEQVLGGTGPVEPPECPDDAHPIARYWFDALKESGQAVLFQPSDWAAALYVVVAMSRNLAQKQRFSAQLFSATWTSMEALLTTEAARRRLRIEVQRGMAESVEQEKPVSIEDRRKAIGG